MDFFDPAGESLVTPKVMVKNLTRRGVSDGPLQVDSCTLIAVNHHDLRALSKALQAEPLEPWKAYREVYRGYVEEGGVTLALSPIGAPNVVALAEELASFGMEKALFLGYCGSLQPKVRAGDIVVPTETIREEGTSFHYLPPGVPSRPQQEIQAIIVEVLQRNRVPYHQGTIWTTDAMYRETRGKVRRYQEEGVLGVEMELSALFGFGISRGIKTGGLLVVSDELFDGRWRPLFSSPKFIIGVKRARKIAVQTLRKML